MDKLKNEEYLRIIRKVESQPEHVKRSIKKCVHGTNNDKIVIWGKKEKDGDIC